MADVSKIKLPNGTTYDIKDNISGYTTNTGTITKVQTTAGAHTTINVSSGAAAFNVPTKTSHLTNDSGFITSYTDEKVKVNFVTGDSVYYLAGKMGNTTGITELSSHGSARIMVSQDIDTIGSTYLILGNSIDQGTAGSKYGAIRLFSRTTKSIDLRAVTTLSNDRTIDLPDKNGTIALTSDIPTVPSNIVNTITTTAGAHTAITSQKGDVSFSIPTTAAHVGAATSGHVHGNITNGGDITATAPTIANGDQIIINDNSASKITNGPTFDGSTTTKALTQKGTWETFLKSYSMAEDTSGTVYNVVLNTGTSSSFSPHRDSDGKYDDDAVASGLYYQSAVLYTPALVVGDVNYTITTDEYDAIDSMLESLNV